MFGWVLENLVLPEQSVAQAPGPGPGPGPRAQAPMEGVAPSVSQRGMHNSEESAGKGGDTMTTRIKGSGGKGRGKGVKGREGSEGGGDTMTITSFSWHR